MIDRVRSSPLHRAAPAAALALAAAVGCHDATSPGDELTGTWVAAAVNDSALPHRIRCVALGCYEAEDLQLRFRSRHRVLDVRRIASPSSTDDIGDAYGYALDGTRITVTRPLRVGSTATGSYADTGTVAGDTIFLHVRSLDPRVQDTSGGSGPVVRYVRAELPQ